jgi:hypothetical protein
VTFKFIAADYSKMQGYLAVCAAVFESEHLTALATVQHDGKPGKTAAESLAHPQFLTPSKRVPEVGMGAHAAQVEGRRRIRRAHIDQIRAIFRHQALQMAILSMKQACNDTTLWKFAMQRAFRHSFAAVS